MKILQPVTAPESPHIQRAYRFAFVIFALLVVWVQTIRFDEQSYREDEVNTVHAVQTLSFGEIAQWLAQEGTHPPGWRWFSKVWIETFGGKPEIGRFQSTLFTLIALALIYRLGADVFDHQVGFLALCILGLQPFFNWHMHELRPYAMLVMWTAAMHVLFLRWVRHQTFPYALGVVACGVLGFQTHYFMIYVIGAQAIVGLALLRYDPLTYLRGFGLGAAIGLSFTAWILPIIYGAFVVRAGGLDYAISSDVAGVSLLMRNIQMLPILVFPMLLIPMSAVYPYRLNTRRQRDSAWRGGSEWPRWYIMGLGLSILGLMFGFNAIVGNLTDRNSIIIAPTAGVAGGYLLRGLTARLRLITVGTVVGVGLVVFHAYYPVPYKGLFAHMRPDFVAAEDGVVTAISRGSVGTTEMVYMVLEEWRDEQFSKQAIFSISEKGIYSTYHYNPDPLAHFVQDYSPESQAEFDAFLTQHDQIWYIRYAWEEYYGASLLAALYQAHIECYYIPIERTDFPLIQRGENLGVYTVTQYQRAPAPRCGLLGMQGLDR